MREFVTMFHRFEDLLPRAINPRNQLVIKRSRSFKMMLTMKVSQLCKKVLLQDFPYRTLFDVDPINCELRIHAK